MFGLISKRINEFLTSANVSGFLQGHQLGPVTILKLSETFPKLNIRKEDIYLCHEVPNHPDQFDLILTSLHLYVRDHPIGRVTLKDFQELPLKKKNLVLGCLGEDCRLKFISLIQSICADRQLKSNPNSLKKQFLHNPDNKSSFTQMTTALEGKFRQLLNEKEGANAEYSIDLEYLTLLQTESSKIIDLCEELNKDSTFVQALNRMLSASENALEYKAQHILLYDIVKVYKKLSASHSPSDPTPLKGKFILAYLFERFQGKDMAASISLGRINKMVQSKQFDNNINRIVNAALFEVPTGYEDEFLLPSILIRIDHLEFDAVSSFIYRIASMIAKSDGSISDPEKVALKQISDKARHPKRKIAGIRQTEVDTDDTLENVMQELSGLIGLQQIKEAVQNLTNFLKVQKIREQQGLKAVNTSLHSVFIGPPGTGKTTVARLIGRIFKHLGYLEKGHMVEADRAGLVAGYVGQTAIKIDEVIKSALGGVLFIDEAYSLAQGNAQRDFGNEAVEVLLKRMEDSRQEFVVIVAGYPDEMKLFIQSNPGLQSRFNRYFTFTHYDPNELLDIFMLFAKKADFLLTEDARDKLFEIFHLLYEKKNPSFGNARVVRNLFEQIMERQANRIVNITPLTKELLVTFSEEDIPPILKTVENILVFKDKDE